MKKYMDVYTVQLVLTNVPIKHTSNKIKGTFINLENSLMPFLCQSSSPLEANTDMISIAINSFCFFQIFI